MSRKKKKDFYEENISTTEEITNDINDFSGEISENTLNEHNLENDNITLVDNYSEHYENFSSQTMNEPEMKAINNGIKFHKPNLKFKKPILKRSPVYLLTSATSNIKKTADSIRMVANSVDGIVNSIELLAPVISSLSKNSVHTNVDENDFVSNTPDEQDYSRDMGNFNQTTKPPLNQASFTQFLENPLVQNMLKNLANNQKQ
ncbi:hypothetical protein SAMN00017405_2297 [Desulfonispora thiosulfatigenes DSM 11270]|uniref:Uncharacterized protein n=1 Tax=Desulfonispora thiosulfatigenes DSM 11270 TaxID=656914 RepID=A0A1W1VDL5_DESTI|nr:hypothetical protein [Desulfonispora thiosulfatigenes]SMB91415.1 hypothetical protein SAMN00017405_2297 [Desulfonispora thiosulfatigenes DSM 11270]